MGGHGDPSGERSSDVGRISFIEKIRQSGELPTASSQFSFTAPPTEDWNHVTVFAGAKRMNHCASASFLGTFYQQAVDRGISFPGPGTYEVRDPPTVATSPLDLVESPSSSP